MSGNAAPPVPLETCRQPATLRVVFGDDVTAYTRPTHVYGTGFGGANPTMDKLTGAPARCHISNLAAYLEESGSEIAETSHERFPRCRICTNIEIREIDQG